MKKNLPLAMIILVIAFSFDAELQAQKLLHYWHFNNTLPVTGAGGTHFGTNAMNADYTRWVSKAGMRYTKVPNCVKDTGYWDNNLGDTINQRVAYGGCCPAYTATTNNSSIRCRNPSDSMQFLWYIPTKNFKNIVIKYESMASSTASGQHRQNYDYSLDSGVTYITTGLPKLFDSAGTAWGKIIVNLSTITSLNNNNKLIFRIRFGAPNTGASGNNRFDNITVEGDSIISTAGINEITSSSNGYKLYPNPGSDNIYINSTTDGVKNVFITNVMGQTVIETEREGKEFPMDISHLNSGIYFVRISEENELKGTTLKFVKN